MSGLSKLNPNFVAAFDGPKLAGGLLLKIQAEHLVLRAFLFGSAAEGKNTAHSDLDFLLVIPDDADKKTYFSFVNQPFFSTVAVDWLILNQTEFEQQKEIGGVARIAWLTGIQLFPKVQASDS